MKVKTKFAKFLIIYVCILFILMLIFFAYIADSLIKYEKYQVLNYAKYIVDEIKSGANIEINNITLSKFENSEKEAKEGIKQILANDNIQYKTEENCSETSPICDVCINEEAVLKIYLKEEKKENRIGLLTFSKWETENVEVTGNGLYSYEISVPSNYEVLVNNVKLDEEDISDETINEGLTQISKYVDIPYMIKYKVTNLYEEPEIEVLDENHQKTETEIDGNVISKQLEYKKVENKDDVELDNMPDVMKIAEQWSLYLTDDLSGSQHGFGNISTYLIKESDLYNYAKKWGTGVDITFVTSHLLENPTFTNEEISNFEVYSDDAFSCEIYLQKNLRLKTGKKIEDIMHEKMYFANYTDENGNKSWKLVNMQSIIES